MGKKRSMVNNVAMCETQLAQKSRSNQASFCWSAWRMCDQLDRTEPVTKPVTKSAWGNLSPSREIPDCVDSYWNWISPTKMFSFASGGEKSMCVWISVWVNNYRVVVVQWRRRNAGPQGQMDVSNFQYRGFSAHQGSALSKHDLEGNPLHVSSSYTISFSFFLL